jgi:glycosyltransferase involved in cell wall biosynthesis
VAQLINGAELVLMTSHSEGSPQIIKEAVACGQRIVTVDVGDVREQLDGLPGCHVCPHDETLLVKAVRSVLESERIPYDASDRFNSILIAKTILNKYQQIIKDHGEL